MSDLCERLVLDIEADLIGYAKTLEAEGRKPTWRDYARVAAKTQAAHIARLTSALETIGSQAICYGMAASEDELRDWLKFIAETAEATLEALRPSTDVGKPSETRRRSTRE